MPLYSRLVILFIVSSVVLSPVAGFEEELKSKFYTMSMKESSLKKKYKVRAFFLDYSSPVDIYSIPKMPNSWQYSFNSERSRELIAAAYSDKDAVDIGFFKDFLSIILKPNHPNDGLYFRMKLIYYKPDGTPSIITLNTGDFVVKEIYKDPKEY